MMKIVLENYKIPSWNAIYSSPHWTKRQEMKDDAMYAVMEALNGKKLALFDKPVQITVIGHFKRVLDSDNICDKIIIDSLKNKIIKNDSPLFVKRVITESVKDTKDFTEVIIEEVK